MKQKTIVTIVGGDTHFPYQDDKAIEVFLSVIEDIRPERIILNGDIADVLALNRFSKDPSKALQLQEEIDQTKDFLKSVSKLASRRGKEDSQVQWILGNHELRWMKFLNDKAPVFAYLDKLEFEAIYDTRELGIEVVRPKGGSGAYTKVGLVSVGHFDHVRKHSGWTAKALVESRFETVVQGHVHRLGEFYVTTAHGVYAGFEGGCLCDLTPEYVTDPNWQQGFTVITQLENSNRFYVQLVPILGGECLFNGTLY